MKKKLFLSIISCIALLNSNIVSAQENNIPEVEEIILSYAMNARLKYEFLYYDNKTFVDGKINDKYVEDIYNKYSETYQTGMYVLYTYLKNKNTLSDQIKTYKKNVENSKCINEMTINSCKYLSTRQKEMIKVAELVDHDYSYAYISRNIFDKKTNIQNLKNMIIEKK